MADEDVSAVPLSGALSTAELLRELARRFEAASVAYASAHGITRDEDWFLLKMQEELGELTQAWIKRTQRGRAGSTSAQELTQALADESADLLGHVLLFVHRHELDLAAAIFRKWRFEL